jgi:PucR family transcriptional regulator, purine catabolism regulatory protein
VSLNLQTVLNHPGFEHSSPEVLAGNPRNRSVRWVHSSDIYEIAPLLHGGELLLTTGLGLTTVGPEERRAFVRALAEKNVAGLALELRSFSEVPAEMVEEARRLDLTLVALRSVHPFVDVTQQINSDILESSIARLRYSDDVGRALSRVLAEQGGLDLLTKTLADLLRRPVSLCDALGSVVACCPEDGADAAATSASRASVTLNGALVGELVIGHGDSDDQLLAAAVERAPEFFAIEMLRSGQQAILVANAQRDVLEQLLAGSPGADEALIAHASASRIRPDSRWVGLTVDADPRPGVETLREIARRCGLLVITAEVDARAYGLVSFPAGLQHDEVAGRLRSAIRPHGPTVAVGPGVSARAAGRSLRAAGQALDVHAQRRVGVVSGDRLVFADTLVVERLLAAVPDATLLRDLVDEELGDLERAPNAHALVGTLETYLATGCSKAATARALHLRRQSVHQRLARVSAWLGKDITAPERQAALRLALAARHTLAVSSQHR